MVLFQNGKKVEEYQGNHNAYGKPHFLNLVKIRVLIIIMGFTSNCRLYEREERSKLETACCSSPRANKRKFYTSNYQRRVDSRRILCALVQALPAGKSAKLNLYLQTCNTNLFLA